MSLRTRLAVALAASAAFTVLVLFTPLLEPGARNAGLHVAVETAGSVIAVLAALLVYGRFQRSLRRSDLVLAAALGAFAVANLGFSQLPVLLTNAAEEPAAWGSLMVRLIGAALLTAAACMRPCEVRRPRVAARRWLGGCGLAVSAVAVATVLAAPVLPAPVPPEAGPGDAFAAYPVITALEAVMMVLLGVAAVGFARRAATGGDQLIGWFAIASVFGAFARLHYVIYPSVLTDWFAAGDVLRLAFFASLFAGGVAELRLAQRALTAAAVSEERLRIARDLHDGTAQDLAFILQATRRMVDRGPSGEDLERLVVAAGHALGNTRNAISDLFRPSDEPLVAALTRTADDVAGREHVSAEVLGAPDLQVPPATREGLCRLVREAVVNAVRHGGADAIRITVRETPELHVRIEDDGSGFEVDAARSGGRYGLVGMAQRVAVLGGELTISSAPGEGTQVLVVLP